MSGLIRRRPIVKQLRGVLALALVIALMSAVLPVLGQEEPVDANLYFHDMWVRSTASATAAQAMAGTPTPEGGAMSSVSAAYMTLANAGGVGVRLVAAASPVAGVVEIHETQMNGDVMQMRPVEGGIPVLPGEVTQLAPGGLHIMLMQLTEPLEVGQAVWLTLTFETLDDAGAPTGETFDMNIAAPVLDEAPEPGNFAFSVVWARPGAAGGVSAAYMRLLNFGAESDTLVAASTDVAGLVEIHEMAMNNDVMQMRPLEGGVTVASGDLAMLEPGGIHVMLMNLPDALEADSAFVLTLDFASGAQIILGVPVYDRTMQMQGM
jgi:copper(I)-binding protein